MKVVKETSYIPMQCKLSDRKSLRDIRSDMLINKLIEDFYFFEENTKYISSSAVKKSVFFTSA